MQIININGPINAGKSTISKLLTQKLSNAIFIEVDDLLSDQEQESLGLSMEQGWAERTNRLDKIIKKEKQTKQFDYIVFAYPITPNLYNQYKNWEDDNVSFLNITLSPRLEICKKNRGTRELESHEIERIEQMYKENYHKPSCSDLIIDNSDQTPQQTLDVILSFLKGCKMEIRNFKKEDLSQVLDLCREVRDHHMKLLNGYFTPQNDYYEQMGFMDSLEDNKYCAFVAVVDEQVVGYLLAERKISPHLIHSNVMHVCNFGVKQNIRGTGVGKKLMDTLFDLCIKEGVEEISLGVYNKNTIAYSFYEKYGFKPIEQKMTLSLTDKK